MSEYAATAPAEDFAEVFMLYVKHSGVLPARNDTPAIRRKWRFVGQLVRAVSKGLRTW